MNKPLFLQFSKQIRTYSGLREFNFLLRIYGQELFYNVDVADERGNRFEFNMNLEEGAWTIKNRPLPDWIVASELDLREAIEEQKRNMEHSA